MSHHRNRRCQSQTLGQRSRGGREQPLATGFDAGAAWAAATSVRVPQVAMSGVGTAGPDGVGGVHWWWGLTWWLNSHFRGNSGLGQPEVFEKGDRDWADAAPRAHYHLLWRPSRDSPVVCGRRSKARWVEPRVAALDELDVVTHARNCALDLLVVVAPAARSRPDRLSTPVHAGSPRPAPSRPRECTIPRPIDR